jgi:SAM-dependent methyltransferase
MLDFIEDLTFPWINEKKDQIRRLLEDKEMNWVERNRCLCGSSDVNQIFNRDRFGLTLPIMLCESCGLIYFAKVLDEASIPKFYNRHYESKGARTDEEMWHQYKFILPHLLGRCAADKASILDIGAGEGSLSVILRDNLSMINIKASLSALEISQKWHKTLSAKGFEIISSFDALEKQYDLIVLSHALEHLSDPLGYLKRLIKFLSPSGLLFIACPGLFNLHDKFQYSFRYFSPFYHFQAFNGLSLSHLANLANLYPIQVDESIRGVFSREAGPGIIPPEVLSTNAERIRRYLKHIEANKSVWPRQKTREFEVKEIGLRELVHLTLRRVRMKLKNSKKGKTDGKPND